MENKEANDVTFDRELPTGLGDRLGIYLCAAAMGKAMNKVVHTYWTEDANPPKGRTPRRHYPYNIIKTLIKFPDNLVFHMKDELDKLEYPKLLWSTGELKPKLALDCLPTSGYLTFSKTYNVKANVYREAYLAVAKELKILCPDKLPEGKYGVIHVRVGDKCNWRPKFQAATQSVLNEYVSKTKMTFYIVTDEQPKKIPLQFPPNCKFYDGSSHTAHAQKNMLQDFNLLIHASCIVQHSRDGWSAFSHIASCINETPILNTYPPMNPRYPVNLLDYFEKLKIKPNHFYRYNERAVFYHRVHHFMLSSSNPPS